MRVENQRASARQEVGGDPLLAEGALADTRLGEEVSVAPARLPDRVLDVGR